MPSGKLKGVQSQRNARYQPCRLHQGTQAQLNTSQLSSAQQHSTLNPAWCRQLAPCASLPLTPPPKHTLAHLSCTNWSTSCRSTGAKVSGGTTSWQACTTDGREGRMEQEGQGVMRLR